MKTTKKRKIPKINNIYCFRLAEKIKVMSVVTFGSEQLAQKLTQAHIDSFQLTRSVVFVGSTAVVNRVAKAMSHKANGVLRLWVCKFKKKTFFQKFWSKYKNEVKNKN